MNSFPRALAALFLAFALLPSLSQAGEYTTPADTNVIPYTQEIPWGITGSAGGTSDDFYGGVELLYPLWFDGDTLLFLYPEVEIADRDRQAYALGLGLRHFFEEWNAIAGISAFWDITSSTYDNTYNGFGLSGEILTKWIDARLNWYLNSNDQNLIDSQTQNSSFSSSSTSTSFGSPFAQGNQILQPSTTTTTTRTTDVSQTFERFEAAMDGLDVEAGFQVPYFKELTGGMELRFFAGYYTYDNPFGDDIEGFKARGELRVTEWLTGDIAYYEDEELFGGNVYGGARIHFPLGKIERPVHVGGGYTPASHAPASYGKGGIGKAPVTFGKTIAAPTPEPPDNIAHRLTENIIRTPRIITADSGYIENEDKRKESTSTTRKSSSSTKVVLDDVVFVNNGPATDEGVAEGQKASMKDGPERGTAENPAYQIQEGVDIAEVKVNMGWEGNVFVQGGAGNNNYVEDVNLPTSMNLYGQVPAYGGHTFGGPVKPVIDGGIGGADFNRAKINAFTIIGGRRTSVPGAAQSDGGIGDGIYLEDVPNVYITNNMISNAGANIADLLNPPVSDGGEVAEGVATMTPFPDGIHIDLNTGQDLNATITGNTVTNSYEHGIVIDVNSGGDFNGLVANNSSNNNGTVVFAAVIEGDEAPEVAVGPVPISAFGDGYNFEVDGNWFGDIANNDGINNARNGLYFRALNPDTPGFPKTAGDFTGNIYGNDFSYNGTVFSNPANGLPNTVNGDGVDLEIVRNFKGNIFDNYATHNVANGFDLFIGDSAGQDVSGSFMGDIYWNRTNDNGTIFFDSDTMLQNGAVGRGFELTNRGNFMGNIYQNDALRNKSHGYRIDIGVGGTGDFTGHIWGNRFNENGTISLGIDPNNPMGPGLAVGSTGFGLDFDLDGHYTGNFFDNIANDNKGDGIEFDVGSFVTDLAGIQRGVGDFVGNFYWNQAHRNGVRRFDTGDGGDGLLDGGSGIGMDIDIDGNFIGDFAMNHATYNATDGVEFDVGHSVFDSNANQNIGIGGDFRGHIYANQFNNNGSIRLDPDPNNLAGPPLVDGANGIGFDFRAQANMYGNIYDNIANDNFDDGMEIDIGSSGIFDLGPNISTSRGDFIGNITWNQTHRNGTVTFDNEGFPDTNPPIPPDSLANGSIGKGADINIRGNMTGDIFMNFADDNANDGWEFDVGSTIIDQNLNETIGVQGNLRGDIYANQFSNNGTLFYDPDPNNPNGPPLVEGGSGDGLDLDVEANMLGNIFDNIFNDNVDDGMEADIGNSSVYNPVTNATSGRGDFIGDIYWNQTHRNGRVVYETISNVIPFDDSPVPTPSGLVSFDSGEGIDFDGDGNFIGNVYQNYASNNADDGIELEVGTTILDRDVITPGFGDFSSPVGAVGDFNGNIWGNITNNNGKGPAEAVDPNDANQIIIVDSGFGDGLEINVRNNFVGDIFDNIANNNADDGLEIDIGDVIVNEAGIVSAVGNFTGDIYWNQTHGNGTEIFDPISGDLVTNDVDIDPTADPNGDLGYGIEGRFRNNFTGNISKNYADENAYDGHNLIFGHQLTDANDNDNVVGVAGTFTGNYEYNSTNTNGQSGAYLFVHDTMQGHIIHNTANNNLDQDGIFIDIGTLIGNVGWNTTNGNDAGGFDGFINRHDVGGGMTGHFLYNTANDNGNQGFDPDFFNDSNQIGDWRYNTAARNGNQGFDTDWRGTGGQVGDWIGNLAYLNESQGFDPDWLDTGSQTGDWIDNRAIMNDSQGFDPDWLDGGSHNGNWTNNYAYGNRTQGFDIDINDGGNFNGNWTGNVAEMNGVNFGSEGIDVRIEDGFFNGSFTGNHSQDSGGIGIELDANDVRNGSFTGNTSTGNGGAGFVDDVGANGGNVIQGGNTSTGNTGGDFIHNGAFPVFQP